MNITVWSVSDDYGGSQFMISVSTVLDESVFHSIAQLSQPSVCMCVCVCDALNDKRQLSQPSVCMCVCVML